jgi:hypothetical protein
VAQRAVYAMTSAESLSFERSYKRLEQMIAAELVRAVSREERDGAPTRAYRELCYRTQNSWTRERRVVAKVEWLGDKYNPRFVVTAFSEEQYYFFDKPTDGESVRFSDGTTRFIPWTTREAEKDVVRKAFTCGSR